MKLKTFISYNNLIHLFFYIFFFTSQFYLNKDRAGQFQYSYIFFILFSLLIARYLFMKRTVTLSLTNYFITASYFLFWIFFLNTYYFFLYLEFEFIKSTFYFFIGVYVFFTTCIFLYYFNNHEFFKKNLIFCNLSVFLFYIFNLGNYEFHQRYNAFFYGPGQMANWSICIFACHLLLFGKTILKKEILFIYLNLLITIIIILISGTRSAYLSLPMFLFIFLYLFPRLNTKGVFFFLGFCFLISIFYLTFLLQDYIQITIGRFFNINFLDQLEARGFIRILDYPQYLIFGAGQGFDERFYLKSYVLNDEQIFYSSEIHSSLLGILFYYGIFGTVLFILFLYKIIKNLNFIEKISFSLPFIYGLTTYNVRTPIFWVFIGVSVFTSVRNLRNKNL